MAFEEFTKVKGKFSPRVTINSRGGFGLSSGMHHRYGLDKYAAVKLFYDKESNRIGIKPVERESDTSFKLKKRDGEGGAYFSAWSFIEAYAIDLGKYAGRYVPQEIEDQQHGKLFVIDLKANEH
ncbi:MAG: hypothetical protein KGJ13_11260 [Patescibacteria group bacterium]|nr:hypothetical protein [Patescibacteria group bacterium]